jgi:hypothetical protein
MKLIHAIAVGGLVLATAFAYSHAAHAWSSRDGTIGPTINIEGPPASNNDHPRSSDFWNGSGFPMDHGGPGRHYGGNDFITEPYDPNWRDHVCDLVKIQTASGGYVMERPVRCSVTKPTIYYDTTGK